jgi:acyl-coenzyme A synthetase/AMP-(fatty) acid ligase
VGHNNLEDEIRNLLSINLGSAAKPKEFHFLDRIPLTPLGKVDRQSLIEMVSK